MSLCGSELKEHLSGRVTEDKRKLCPAKYLQLARRGLVPHLSRPRVCVHMCVSVHARMLMLTYEHAHTVGVFVSGGGGDEQFPSLILFLYPLLHFLRFELDQS